MISLSTTSPSMSLLQHQLNSMEKMRVLELEKQIITPDMILDTSIGILADKSGYGKTRTVVSFIKENAIPWDTSLSFYTYSHHSSLNGLVLKKNITRHKRINLTLIVVDKIILNQWVGELSQTNLRVRVIKNEADLKNDITDATHDVVLCSANLYNSTMREMGDVAFKRVIFDDPDNIRITRMKPVLANFIWLVTSNPLNMETVHKNSKNNFFGDIVKYNKLDKFSSYINLIKIESEPSVILPDPVFINHECYSPYYINGVIDECTIELIKENRIMDVLNTIGGKYQETVTCLLDNNNDRKCSICYEPIKNLVMEPECQNLFCAHCLLVWLKDHKKCPLCRVEIKLNKLIYEIPGAIERVLLTKEMVIKSLITNADATSRFVIYSDKESSLIPIKNTVSECGASILEIKGSPNMINSTLAQFKTKNKIIYLNSKFYATGLDLKNTTDLIIYHTVSEQNKDHLISRCNRLGRTSQLRIHTLCYIGSD
jgi:hypothetical protein